MKESTIKQQTQTILAQLPLEGLEELAHFLEFLSFKYHLQPPATTAADQQPDADNFTDSLTAQFQGFVQSPLKTNELNEAYEQYLTGEEE
jgi:hypothetical protein